MACGPGCRFEMGPSGRGQDTGYSVQSMCDVPAAHACPPPPHPRAGHPHPRVLSLQGVQVPPIHVDSAPRLAHASLRPASAQVLSAPSLHPPCPSHLPRFSPPLPAAAPPSPDCPPPPLAPLPMLCPPDHAPRFTLPVPHCPGSLRPRGFCTASGSPSWATARSWWTPRRTEGRWDRDTPHPYSVRLRSAH